MLKSTGRIRPTAAATNNWSVHTTTWISRRRGRNENGPAFDLTDWVRHHDKYEVTASRSCCGRRS